MSEWKLKHVCQWISFYQIFSCFSCFFLFFAVVVAYVLYFIFANCYTIFMFLFSFPIRNVVLFAGKKYLKEGTEKKRNEKWNIEFRILNKLEILSLFFSQTCNIFVVVVRLLLFFYTIHLLFTIVSVQNCQFVKWG